MDPHCITAMELILHAIKSNKVISILSSITYAIKWVNLFKHLNSRNLLNHFSKIIGSFTLMPTITLVVQKQRLTILWIFMTNMWYSVLIFIWIYGLSWVFNVNTVHVAVRALVRASSSDWKHSYPEEVWDNRDNLLSPPNMEGQIRFGKYSSICVSLVKCCGMSFMETLGYQHTFT